MIRRTCIFNSDTRFRQGLDVREDIIFLLDLLPHIEHIAYLPKALYIYNKYANTHSLSNTYLTESRHYYEQEILWHQAALDSPLINEENKRKMVNSLLNDAYITLSGKYFSAEEWKRLFVPYTETFNRLEKSYKQRMVAMSLNGHFLLASFFRRMIVLVRRKA